jgi:hypothetical protein
MSDTKRSTAEFQRPPQGAFETTTPGADTSASRQTRRLQRTAALWQGAEERGGGSVQRDGPARDGAESDVRLAFV